MTNTVFATRSGGHNPNPGFASVDSRGVLIDLSQLKEITLNHDHSYLSTGPGNHWDQVYRFLSTHEVTVLGGRVPGVGVGGVLLGGGLSWLSGHYGLACDNVLEYEVVLSNATIVKASAQVNSDLFWALKGGGANFGIVTKFILRTVPVEQFWFASLTFSPNQTEAVRQHFL